MPLAAARLAAARFSVVLIAFPPRLCPNGTVYRAGQHDQRSTSLPDRASGYTLKQDRRGDVDVLLLDRFAYLARRSCRRRTVLQRQGAAAGPAPARRHRRTGRPFSTIDRTGWVIRRARSPGSTSSPDRRPRRRERLQILALPDGGR